MLISQFINNILKAVPVTVASEFDFVKSVWMITHPDKVYNEEVTKKAFSMGLKSKIIQGYINKIIEDPKTFNIQINKLIDKTGKIIKQECIEL